LRLRDLKGTRKRELFSARRGLGEKRSIDIRTPFKYSSMMKHRLFVSFTKMLNGGITSSALSSWEKSIRGITLYQ